MAGDWTGPNHKGTPESPLPRAQRSQDRIVARPDGYHWVALDGKQEFGPFDTIEEAQADRDTGMHNEGAPGPAETLKEAERDIGIADWIDPETGEPAEGQSPPHLEGD